MGCNPIRIFVVAALVSIAGCAAALYVPNDGDATSAAGRDELLHGRGLYVRNCGSCHSLFLPEAYTGPDWERHLREMAPRARLTDEEQDLIWRFLLAGTQRTVRQ